MKLLEFNLILKTSKTTEELMRMINSILGCDFDDDSLYEKGQFYTTWKSVNFGLQISLTYFSDTDEYYVEGFPSTKVIFLIPIECKLEQTDISNEMLNLFRLAAPEDNWSLARSI